MSELKASGQTALRAKALRKEARRTEDQARAMTDAAKKVEILERASRLKDEALDLESASRWFAYLDRMEMIGKNKGEQAKTVARKKFLREVAKDIGTTKRFKVCKAAEVRPEFSKLFRSYEEAYRFAEPKIFDGIRRPS